MVMLVEAVQLMLSDWHRRKAAAVETTKAIDFLTFVGTRAISGFEPAKRLLRAEGLPPCHVKPRATGTRVRSDDPDINLVEYIEDTLEYQWGQDCAHADSSIDIESYWNIQNRLRRLFGLNELTEDALRDALDALK